MSFFFATQTAQPMSPVARAFCAGVPLTACNDNGDEAAATALLHATLRHFAEFGLSAAAKARDFAAESHHEGDECEAKHWMAICRMLDRRMACAAEMRALIA